MSVIASGSWFEVEQAGRPIKTWAPAPVASLLDELTGRTQRHAAQATAALERSAGALPLGWEPVARLLLRAEGVASSQIEDVRAPVADIAAAEIAPALASKSANWVVDNLNTVLLAMHEVTAPLTVEALHGWHRTLMRSADHLDPRHFGAFRDQIGFVGGGNARLATHVGTHPDRLADAMSDLVGFVNRDDVEPTVQAGLAHAQFELIHPYADGNGRLGRVLIGWIYLRRLRLAVPPPISVLLARGRPAYVSSLTGYRELGPDHWLAFFVEIAKEAADGVAALLDGAAVTVTEWESRLVGLRRDAAACRALAVLAGHPVVTADLLAGRLGISQRAARTALATLHERGVLSPYQPARQPRGRPTLMWQVPALVSLITAWAPPG